MKRIIPALISLALISAAAFGQSEPALKFDLADIHTTPRSSSSPYAQMRSTFYRGGRYEIRFASIVDLISLAWGVETDKVLSGPAWLETDRFDVIATAPATATRENLRTMLQALLEDRFALKLHKDTKDLPALALTAGKQPKLKEADGSGPTGCNFEIQNMNNKDAGPPTFSYKCGNTTMAAFVEYMPKMTVANQYLNNNPVIDETSLKGAWNFDFHFTYYSGAVAGGANVLFDAIDKQLGLKLEARKVPVPVVIVDSVNQTPKPNLPEVTEKRLGVPTAFEVAEIKPSDPNASAQNRSPFMPGGRLELRGMLLKQIIAVAWDTSPDKIVGAPKFIDSDKYDILAKAPDTTIALSPVNQNSQPPLDIDALRLMLRMLLVDRFKVTVHAEDRPADAYTLLATKPKLKPADPSNRSGCKDGPGADGKDPRKTNPILNRLVTCRNMTLSQFADALPRISPLYFRGVSPTVVNATGIEGAFDFQLSFSGVQVPQGGGRGGDSGRPAAAGGAAEAVDPGGILTLFDAMEKQIGIKMEMQKHPMPVLVVDHIDPKPTDN